MFTLNTSANPFCQPFPPAMHIYEADQNSGLTMNYPSSTTTPCASLTTLKGWWNPSDIVTFSHPGVSQTYMGIKLLVGIVIKGTWSGAEKITT